MRCALKGGVYDAEESTALNGADHVLIEPFEASDVVIFDGTDPVVTTWTAHASLPDVVVRGGLML